MDHIKTTLLLLGGGGHCRSCIDVIEAEGEFNIVGIVDKKGTNDISCMNYPLLGTDSDLIKLLEQYQSAIVTVGQIKSAETRIRLFEKLKSLGADIPRIVSPHSYLSKYSHVGAGTIIMHRALINANTNIGENCIINSQVLFEHDTIIESHCHISTGVKVNGGVHIEQGSFIGSGAVIRENVRIGARCIVGAGAIVLNDIPSGTLFRG